MFEKEMPVYEKWINFFFENTDMTKPGLKTLLKRLEDKGLIKKQGQGKGTTYSI